MIAGVTAVSMLGMALVSGAILMYMLVSSDQGYGDAWLGVSAKSIRRKKAKQDYRDAISGRKPLPPKKKKEEPLVYF